MYVRTVDGSPFTLDQIRFEHPNTGVPSAWAGGEIEGVEYAVVTPTAPPQISADQLVSEGLPALINGVWFETWVVRDLTPDEIAQALEQWRQTMAVTPLQARRALRAAGLITAVDAAVAAADEDTREAWEYAIEVRRTDPVLTAVAAQLGLTSDALDDLFRDAARR